VALHTQPPCAANRPTHATCTHQTRLRDDLLDAARARVDRAGESAVASVSLGQALSDALAAKSDAAKQEAGGVKREGDGGKDGEGDTRMEAAHGAEGEVNKEGGEAAGVKEEGGEQEQEEKGGGEEGPVTEDQLRVLDWHWANLEYGCSAPSPRTS